MKRTDRKERENKARREAPRFRQLTNEINSYITRGGLPTDFKVLQVFHRSGNGMGNLLVLTCEDVGNIVVYA